MRSAERGAGAAVRSAERGAGKGGEGRGRRRMGRLLSSIKAFRLRLIVSLNNRSNMKSFVIVSISILLFFKSFLVLRYYLSFSHSSYLPHALTLYLCTTLSLTLSLTLSPALSDYLFDSLSDSITDSLSDYIRLSIRLSLTPSPTLSLTLSLTHSLTHSQTISQILSLNLTLTPL